MKRLLLINSSPNLSTSTSRQLASYFTTEWSKKNLDSEIIRRDIGKDPIPHLLDDTVEGIVSTELKTEQGRKTRQLSDTLIKELKECNPLLIAMPMHNFGMPSSLKAYFDHVIRYGVTVGSKDFADKQVIIITTGGGNHENSDHDFQGPHIQYLLGFIGIKPEQITFVRAHSLLFSAQHKANSILSAEKQIEVIVQKLLITAPQEDKRILKSQDEFPVNTDYLSFSAKLFEPVKIKSYTILGIDDKSPRKLDVLDVGCGIGIDTLRMADYLTKESQIIGIDIDPQLIETGNAQAYMQNKLNVKHYQMDASKISYLEKFDGVRSERLFQHLKNPEEVLAKMAQAVKDQGIVVVIDTDWESLNTKALSTTQNKTISKFYCTTIPNGGIAKNLTTLFGRANLSEIKQTRLNIPLDKQAYGRITRHTTLFEKCFNPQEYKAVMSKIDQQPDDKDFGSIESVIVSGMRSRL